MLRMAIPSDGRLHEPSVKFLEACGMSIKRASARRYTASMPSLPQVTVLFQRTADITSKVDEGSADMGIVGLDNFLELRREGGNAFLVMQDLGFGNCDLVLGVPDSWVDVNSTADLADLSAEFREQGKELRIATKHRHLVERFMYRKGINYFTLVPASGAMEAAPAVGFADMIADISSTGATLKENRLKTVGDGSILSSQACLIGNKRGLSEYDSKLEEARVILERVEAHSRAQEYSRITANLPGESPGTVAEKLLSKAHTAGLHGPTISPVYGRDGKGQWFSVTLVVHKIDLLKCIDCLREIGGVSITVFQPDYVFQKECISFTRMMSALGKATVA